MDRRTVKDEDAPGRTTHESGLAFAVVCPTCAPAWLSKTIERSLSKEHADLHNATHQGHRAVVVATAYLHKDELS